MDLSAAYVVRMSLTPVGDRSRHLFEVTLRDEMRVDVFADSTASLDFNGASLVSGLDAPRFLNDFRSARAVGEADGLAFGRLLFRRLMSDVAGPERQDVRDLWAGIETARIAREAPLRLELVLPRGEAGAVGDIPFELLADDGGFLFRRAGHVLVRTFQGMSGVRALIRRGDRATVVWANPLIETEAGNREVLPAAIFEEHERALAEAGTRLGLIIVPPLRHATRSAFDRHLHDHSPQVVAVAAHGDPSGGALLFHDERRSDYPRDPGRSLRASDIAATFREAAVRIAFLWSCHGARRHPDSGAVAEALLDERQGNLAAVVAAHAAFRAIDTPTVARATVIALEGVAEGDLERAVSRARREIPSEDLQWAAPVYYARPLHGQSVSLEEAITGSAATPFRGGVALEEAPEPSPHSRGREGVVAEGLVLLRRYRLVSIVGLPGIGKTEVTLAVAGRASADAQVGFERCLWLSAEGMADPSALRSRMATAFGLERCETDEALGRAVGPSPVLVVLDNAEDLIHAAHLGFQELVVKALEELRQIDAKLGMAGQHGYLARAAQKADQPRHATALAGRAHRMLEALDDRFGQMLALHDLGAGLALLGNEPGAIAALVLAWHEGHAIGHPSAAQRLALVHQAAPDLDREADDWNEQLDNFRAQLADAIQAVEQGISEAGQDLYVLPE